MGVYIKGMEMPKSCWNCTVERQADCDVWRGVCSSSMYKDRRYENCPLVELQPHGRLIDADALPTNDKPIGKLMMFGGEYVYTQTAINNAPTIIPAEEGET